MSPEKTDSDSIGPQRTLSEVSFPPALGEQFRQLYGTDTPPSDGAEWVAQMRETTTSARGRTPTVEDLCTVADGDHAFVGETGTQKYICVLDPLAYPFLTGETGTVQSTTPVRGETVEFTVERDGVTVSHDEAVVSLGVSDHLDAVDVESAPVETVYRQVCGYIQTFVDRAEYETWASEADAETIALSAPDGIAVARELADTLFAGSDGREKS